MGRHAVSPNGGEKGDGMWQQGGQWWKDGQRQKGAACANREVSSGEMGDGKQAVIERITKE